MASGLPAPGRARLQQPRCEGNIVGKGGYSVSGVCAYLIRDREREPLAPLCLSFCQSFYLLLAHGQVFSDGSTPSVKWVTGPQVILKNGEKLVPLEELWVNFTDDQAMIGKHFVLF